MRIQKETIRSVVPGNRHCTEERITDCFRPTASAFWPESGGITVTRTFAIGLPTALKRFCSRFTFFCLMLLLSRIDATLSALLTRGRLELLAIPFPERFSALLTRGSRKFLATPFAGESPSCPCTGSSTGMQTDLDRDCLKVADVAGGVLALLHAEDESPLLND